MYLDGDIWGPTEVLYNVFETHLFSVGGGEGNVLTMTCALTRALARECTHAHLHTRALTGAHALPRRLHSLIRGKIRVPLPYVENQPIARYSTVNLTSAAEVLSPHPCTHHCHHPLLQRSTSSSCSPPITITKRTKHRKCTILLTALSHSLVYALILLPRLQYRRRMEQPSD